MSKRAVSVNFALHLPNLLENVAERGRIGA